eukprot:COSAG06_NODE_17503_length_937_cov_17.558473_3_plen_41_part_01
MKDLQDGYFPCDPLLSSDFFSPPPAFVLLSRVFLLLLFLSS